MREDMTGLIERVPQIESKLGVTIGALYAYGDGEWIHVNGELRPAGGGALPPDLKIHTTFFDAGGRMLGVAEHYVSDDNIIGFEPFALFESFGEDEDKVVRIRVIVRPR